MIRLFKFVFVVLSVQISLGCASSLADLDKIPKKAYFNGRFDQSVSLMDKTLDPNIEGKDSIWAVKGSGQAH